jgi:predicted nucleic acid-binding protein
MASGQETRLSGCQLATPFACYRQAAGEERSPARRSKNASSYSIKPLSVSASARRIRKKFQMYRTGHGSLAKYGVAGEERIFTTVAALVDTNVLVYRFDGADPPKRAAAIELLRSGIARDSLRLAHQAVIEFVSSVTRPRRGAKPLMSTIAAYREAEELMAQFVILYPNEAVLRAALRGAAAYQLS